MDIDMATLAESPIRPALDLLSEALEEPV